MSADLEDRASWEASFPGTIWKQRFHSVPQIPSHISLEGKTAVVTGASGGLGLECARQLLQLHPARLILAVRTQKKGDAVASTLRAEFPNAQIEVWPLDMESYDSVRAFATRCRDTLEKLDVAILNAGCGKQDFERCKGENGREITLQVNYLATVLLAGLLVPSMKPNAKSSSPGRLTMVGSDMAHWTKIPETTGSILDGLDNPKTFDGMQMYGTTKLLLEMYVSKLPTVISPDDVIVNVVNPSAVRNTDLMRNARDLLPRIMVFLSGVILGRNLVNGTRQYLHSALVLDKKSHGSFCDWEIRPYSPIIYTDAGKRITDQLWYETRKELQFAGLDEILGEAKK
ncbi:Fc.00g108010.m01.CDS01 [Cosmosporella sp. VM-42]